MPTRPEPFLGSGGDRLRGQSPGLPGRSSNQDVDQLRERQTSVSRRPTLWEPNRL